MLAQGNYPERLKFSLIKPIYKSGDKSSPYNYRPISLLPAFSKIFEKVNNAILDEHQFRFRSGVNRKCFSYITKLNTGSNEQ